MPVCPNCGYEYVEGITICKDCGETLVVEKFFIRPEKWSEADWVVIFTSNKEYEVDMLRDNLEGADIPAAVLSQKDRNFPAPGDFSVIKLLVHKKDIQNALNFIEQIIGKAPDQEDEE